jgi:hypothetical protein
MPFMAFALFISAEEDDRYIKSRENGSPHKCAQEAALHHFKNNRRTSATADVRW